MLDRMWFKVTVLRPLQKDLELSVRGLGASLGATVGSFLFAPLIPIFPAAIPVRTMLGGTVGAFGGAQGGKALRAFLTGGDHPDRLGPSIVLPGTLNLLPMITSADGNNYVLVQVEVVYRWFSISDNPMLPRYTEVVSGARLAELTNGYLQGSGYGPQVDEYTPNSPPTTRRPHTTPLRLPRSPTPTPSIPAATPGARHAFRPCGQCGGAKQTWSQSAQPGQLLNTLTVTSSNGTVTQMV